MFYDELPVESWRMVGEEGQGFRHLLAGLNPERIMIAAEAIGIGDAALRRAGVAVTSVSSSTGRSARTRASAILSPTHAVSSGMADGDDGGVANYNGMPCRGGRTSPSIWPLTRTSSPRIGPEHRCGPRLRHRIPRRAAKMGEAWSMRIAPISQEMSLNYIAQQVMGLPRSY